MATVKVLYWNHTHFTVYMQIYTIASQNDVLVYTKTVDSVFRALWLAAQTRDIQCYSPIHIQLFRESDAKLT